MKTFSERHGLSPVRSALRRGEIDDRLRNRLWSACDFAFWTHLHPATRPDNFTRFILMTVQDGFFGKSTSDLNIMTTDVINNFKSNLMRLEWNEFFDFVQFMGDFSKLVGADSVQGRARQQGFAFLNRCNETLVSERYGYRFIGSDLCEITDEVQVSEIERAISTTGVDRLEQSRRHLENALHLFAKRPTPDYRNSIKESICSIESYFFVLNGRKSPSMKDAMQLAEQNGFHLHGALRDSILKLFGWTSDEGGIRHALAENEATVNETHARFMLVICSALFNFLVAQKQP